MPESFEEQLRPRGGAYILVRELGGGGMSRVFLARDEALGRDVVVKVLSPALAEGLSAGRFAREIKLAAALQEPHIVPLLTAGETIGGLPFYTMPFVEGESLRQRIVAGQIPVAAAVSILRNMASALAYAHRHGVVHRDIKPENVLLSSGTAVVTDFGIAKALAASKSEAPGGTLTSVGTSLGTPAYMAPEQATGDEVDGRADLYSWGVIAYEILAGAHPFAGKSSAQKLIAAHVVETPPTPDWEMRGVPSSLGTLVMRCLEKDPDARPQSADDIIAAFDGSWNSTVSTNTGSSVVAARGAAHTAEHSKRRRTVMVAAAVIVAAGLAGAFTRGEWSMLRRRSAAANPPAVTRIAVLPFDNVGDTATAYFADGITDEIRAKLIALPALQVIANGSSSQYRHTSKTLQQIGAELSVSYLLVGRVRSEPRHRGSHRVRIAPELIHLVAGQQPISKWQGSYDGDSVNFFDVQAEIASKVAAQLVVALAPSEQLRIARRSTNNLEAWEAMRRAQAIEQDGSALVIQHRAAAAYKEAIRLDPNFAEAWAYLSQVYVSSYLFGVPSPALADSALRAAQRAMALAPDREYSHEAMGTYYAAIGARYDLALEEFKAALAAAPRTARLLRDVARMEIELGRLNEGTAHLEEATTVDPRSSSNAQALALLYEHQRRFPEAVRYADRALALNPTDVDRIRVRVEMSLAQGDLAGASAVVRAAPPTVDSALLVTELARDLVQLVLTPNQQNLLLRLRPDAYGGDRANWAFVLARAYSLRHDATRARAYADTAVKAYDVQLRASPNSERLRISRALMLTYLGKLAEATSEANELRSHGLGARNQPDPHTLNRVARVYVGAGLPDKALDVLEMISQPPFPLTPAWIRLDPDFAPLKGNPRFERLTGTASAR